MICSKISHTVYTFDIVAAIHLMHFLHIKLTVDGHLDTTPPFCVVREECFQPRIHRVSLIAGTEYGMEWWNGIWNGW